MSIPELEPTNSSPEPEREFAPAEGLVKEEYRAEGAAELPMEANPVDSVFQRREVPIDEEERGAES